ncbi:hypothetical protein NQ317_006277 [Molorchus minor]|uniref:Uncharacterized protein n=1 Tax=Molorchus minor TaxID=1323400 RepID=A0ABQ9J588_9CUCU|nr:hypothetical protein NQ317_006277 [Molorchus minor]
MINDKLNLDIHFTPTKSRSLDNLKVGFVDERCCWALQNSPLMILSFQVKAIIRKQLCLQHRWNGLHNFAGKEVNLHQISSSFRYTISVPLPQLIPQFLTPLRHVFFNTTLTSFDAVSSISNCKLNQPAELRDLGAVTTAVSGPMTICFMRIDKFPGPAFKYPILLNANISVIKTYLLRSRIQLCNLCDLQCRKQRKLLIQAVQQLLAFYAVIVISYYLQVT